MRDETEAKDRPDERPPQATILAKLLIVMFVFSYMTVAFVLVIDGWLHSHAAIHRLLGLAPGAKLPVLFVSALHSVIGAILGAGVLGLVSFHKYVAVKQDFQAAHVWGYFIAPWLAAVLGLIVFALLQSGLLVFSGGALSNPQSEIANLGFLAVGFLAGFGWYDFTERIRRLVAQFFATPSDEEPHARPRTIGERILGAPAADRTASGASMPGAGGNLSGAPDTVPDDKSRDTTPAQDRKPL